MNNKFNMHIMHIHHRQYAWGRCLYTELPVLQDSAHFYNS